MAVRLRTLVLRVLASVALPAALAGAVAAETAQSGAPAATTCQLRFDANTVGLPATCLFVGRFNPRCGGQASAVFAGDGRSIVVGLAFSREGAMTFVGGEVTSPTTATITTWWRHPDLADPAPMSGALALDANGAALRLTPRLPAFGFEGCPVVDYVGRFAEMASPDATVVPAALVD
jgi:hypothetical protein